MCDSLPSSVWQHPRLASEGQVQDPLPLRLPRRTALLGLAGVVVGACVNIGLRPRRARHAVVDAGLPPWDARPGASGPAMPSTAVVQKAEPPHVDDPVGYTLVDRASWGAAPLRDNHDPMAKVRRITVHHTAELGGMDAKTDAELVRAVQVFHQETRGWADIGYHYLIGRDGKVYEGRPLHAQGAHAGGGNNVENLGVSLIGEFVDALPEPRQLETLRVFLEVQRTKHKVPMVEVHGHRDFKPTECPGQAVYDWLGELKKTV